MKAFLRIIFFCMAITSVMVAVAQKKNPEASFFSTKYSGKEAIIQYHFAESSAGEKVNLILYRGNEKNEKVKAVYQLNNLPVKSDYYFIDSLLPGSGVYMYTIEIVSNGNVIGREISKLYAFPSSASASISSFTATAQKNSGEVMISWKIGNAALAGNVNILRSRKADDEFTVIASLDNAQTNFTDHVNDANEPFFYVLELGDARSGEFIYSPAIPVVAVFEIKPDAPKNLKAGIADGVAALSWRSEDPLSRGFYVYKRTVNSNGFFQASSFIEQNPRNVYKFIDTAKTKSGEYAQYIVYAESNSYTKSFPSDTVLIEIPREPIIPAAPNDLRFILNSGLASQLTWSVDSLYADDITGYIVYQKKKGEREYSVLKELLNADQNFIDLMNIANGTSFMIKSKSGEKLSDDANEITWTDRSPNDFGPKYLKAEIMDDALIISWKKTDDIIREYRLYKWDGRSYKADQTVDANNNSVAVRSYKSGEANRYILKAVNVKGEENEGTGAITVY